MEPGIYGQPIQRTATLQFPLISGYACARAYVRLANQVSGNPTSNPVLNYDQITANYYNTGGTNGTLQVYQTDDLASGPRTTLGAPVALVAGGYQTVQLTPQAHFLEWWGAGPYYGPTQIKAQLTSQLNMNLLSFSKLDPSYDQAIVAGQYSPAFGALTNLSSPQITNSS